MTLNTKIIKAEINDQFLADDNRRPWIIGFSGGKDSTMLLQLIWTAIKEIPAEIRDQRDIWIVCNNTLVENPKIIQYTEKVLKQIEKAALEQGMPFRIQKTTPKLEDTFWINVIGRGYPSPNNLFRWCTERLKINPTTKFILEKVNENGEVIILLGTRTDESANRAKSMKQHEIFGQRLRKHILPNAYVFAPIKDVLTQDVWVYLNQVPSPWGANNKELVTLYKNANSGDCPLVIDDSTPSCGNSRFGCWVCTVVKRDKSMEGLIENGEEWMYPLLEIRDFLVTSRDEKEKYRERRRRNGEDRSDENIYGPYQPWVRAKILKDVLKAQQQIQSIDPTINLISHQELIAIQILWYRDSIFNERVSDIYNEIFNITEMKNDKFETQKKKEVELLKEVCSDKPQHIPLIEELLSLQKSKMLLQRKHNLTKDIEKGLERFLENQTEEIS
ncbi:MAG: DNA phosphorothioation system sulfurtransferase DndC [Microscillaceae bacterium]|nr:DNA phosphorothioation system sulfurtransferase DndC [Microscillaceae bacterium]